jgi:hypothetical protein
MGGTPGVTIGQTCISVKRAAIGINRVWRIWARVSNALKLF